MVGVGGAGPPLELTSALGERFRAIPYQAGRSLVCVRTVRVAKSGTVDKSLGGCMPFARIAQATNTRAGIVEGITVGETVVLTGYASSDVEAIRGRGPDTAIRANVTPTWTPDAITVPGFRVFIATTSLDVGRDGLDLDDEARATNLWNYKLRAVLKNGRTVPIPP
jgi:hypothetical protein